MYHLQYHAQNFFALNVLQASMSNTGETQQLALELGQVSTLQPTKDKNTNIQPRVENTKTANITAPIPVTSTTTTQTTTKTTSSHSYPQIWSATANSNTSSLSITYERNLSYINDDFLLNIDIPTLL